MENGIHYLVWFLLISSLIYFFGSLFMENYDEKNGNLMYINKYESEELELLS